MGDDGDGESSEAADGGPREGGPSGPGEDKTVPRVELSLQDLSVSVTGRSDDDLESVEESAQDLIAYLVEQTDQLEDDHDEYGLS